MRGPARLGYGVSRPSGEADDGVRSRSASLGAARRSGGALQSSRGSDVERRGARSGDRRWQGLHDAVL